MSDELRLEDVKLIPHETKKFVSAYIHDIELSFPKNNIFYTIPSLIIHWCLLYFYSKDEFDPANANAYYTFSKNNTIAVQRLGGEMAVMLKNIVSAGIHQWKFRILKDNSFKMTFGVITADYQSIATSGQLWQESYQDKAYGVVLAAPNLANDDEQTGIRFSCNCAVNGIVEMILDLVKMELRFIIDGRDYGTMITDLPKCDYKACVSGYSNEASYEILSYQILSQQPN